MQRIFICLVAFVLLAGVSETRAQWSGPDGPVSIVVFYRCKPENRTDFYKYLQTAGVVQFEKWKQQKAIGDYLLLFNEYTDESTWDAMAVLDFNPYTQTGKWKEIEKTMPGGLSAQALKYAWPSATYFTDRFFHGEATGNAAATDQTVYAVTTNSYDKYGGPPVFKSYFETYLVPQYKGWIDAGVLTQYSYYGHMFYPGRPRHAIIVLQYKDLAALGNAEDVRASTATALRAKDAAWRALEDEHVRATMRTEESTVLARAIRPAH